MNIHPLAKLFPEMSPEAYSALKADIQSAGRINEPIVLYQGMILDGRHRYRACQELGIHCSESELPDGSCDEDEAVDPLEFVISANLHRRQLSTKQRAIVGARMATLGRGRPEENSSIDLFSQEEAAGLLGVGVASIKRAKHVLENGHPKLVELVEQDRVSVSLASKFIREVPEVKDQAKIVKLGVDAIKQTVPSAAPKERPPSSDIVTAFRQSPQRLTDLRAIWDDLEAHELAVVQGWLRGEEAD
jgi:ParB-like chromosome segregation protein Spo0J